MRPLARMMGKTEVTAFLQFDISNVVVLSDRVEFFTWPHTLCMGWVSAMEIIKEDYYM